MTKRSDRGAKASPFKILQIFFPIVSIRRPDKLPSESSVTVNAQIQYGYDPKIRRHLVNLRISTPEGDSSGISAEIVAAGLFDFDSEGKPTDAQLVRFINDYLLNAMTSRVVQLFGTVTAQMGMNPIWLPMPRGYGFTVAQFRKMQKTRKVEPRKL